MPAPIRRKSASVTERLLAQPARFGFFQAVRLLERAAVFFNRGNGEAGQAKNKLTQADAPIARFTPPAGEAMRFRNQLTLGHPGAELAKVEQGDTTGGKKQWQVTTAFLSATGSLGVLPFHYTEMIFKRLKLKDDALKRFLDLFHHRTVSLFYQAGTKYRLPIAYERHALSNRRPRERDTHTHAIFSLAGLGTDHLAERLPMDPASLAFYSGFFTQSTRPRANLEQMLGHYFAIPVKVQEFVGEWHDLIDDVRSRLPTPGNPKGQNACLGKSAILGGKGWFAQGKIRIELGPLNRDQFEQFRPGTSALKELNQMTRLFAGAENEVEYVLHVTRAHVPARIQLNNTQPPIVGWDTWLASQPLVESRKGETMAITVSSGRLN